MENESISEVYRVLVVDDEPLVLEIIQDLLTLRGYGVTALEHGEKALDLVDVEAFDLVLTDLGMPEVDGWMVARKVKAKSPKTPVILLTGWGDLVDDSDLSEKGVDVVLTKPIDLQRLVEEVESLLRIPSLRDDKRQYQRFRSKEPSFVVLAAADDPKVSRVGELVDMSLGGFSFEYLHRKKPISASCRATLHVNQGLELANLPCRIVYDVELTGKGGTRRCGVEFGALGDEQFEQLKRILINYTS